MEKRLVLKHKGRFLIFLSIVICLIGITIFLSVNNRAFGYNEPKYDVVYITKGDTLWDIACRNLKPGKEIREYIHEIREINKLPSAELFIGQELILPR